MRDIKFRAFDKKQKKMFYFDEPFYDSEYDRLTFRQQNRDVMFDESMDSLMQFTDYQDTDETDIYENDIIEFEDVTGTKKRGIVLLEEYGVGEKITFKHCGWVVMVKDENTALPEVADKCKVIGDTYTSPDLYFKG